MSNKEKNTEKEKVQHPLYRGAYHRHKAGRSY